MIFVKDIQKNVKAGGETFIIENAAVEKDHNIVVTVTHQGSGIECTGTYNGHQKQIIFDAPLRLQNYPTHVCSGISIAHDMSLVDQLEQLPKKYDEHLLETWRELEIRNIRFAHSYEDEKIWVESNDVAKEYKSAFRPLLDRIALLLQELESSLKVQQLSIYDWAYSNGGEPVNAISFPTKNGWYSIGFDVVRPLLEADFAKRAKDYKASQLKADERKQLFQAFVIVERHCEQFPTDMNPDAVFEYTLRHVETGEQVRVCERNIFNFSHYAHPSRLTAAEGVTVHGWSKVEKLAALWMMEFTLCPKGFRL